MGEWLRVSRGRPCVVCGGGDRCTYTRDGAVAKCLRVRDGAVTHGEDAAGYWHLHRLIDDPDWRDKPRPTRECKPKLPAPEAVAELARRAEFDITPERRERFAESMGLSVASLRRVGLGWIKAETLKLFNTPCFDDGCFSFPMVDGLNQCAGIRLRTPGGDKYALRTPDDCNGAGLFIPRGIGDRGSEYLIITEGPTDLAALLDIGFDAIGRPSNTGGRDMIKRFVAMNQSRLGWSHVVIMIDRDEPGSDGERDTRRGARALAMALSSARRTVKIVQPPIGVKDARDWVRSGATGDMVRQVIECNDAVPVRGRCMM